MEALDFKKLKEDFERDGFLVVPNFATDEEIEGLTKRAQTLLDGFDVESHKVIFSTQNQEKTTNDYFLDSASKISFFFEENAFDEEGNLKQPKENSINKFGHAIHDLDPVFSAFTHSNNVKAVIENIVGYANPLFVQSMYIYKQPRIGGEVRPHQDSWFIHTQPLSCTGLWFALEDADLNNGCLYAIPGSHHGSECPRRFKMIDGKAKFDFPPKNDEYPDEKFVPVPVKKGSLVLIHGLVVHKSYPNYSDVSRQAYTFHIIDGNTVYSPDNWLQRPADFPFVGFTN